MQETLAQRLFRLRNEKGLTQEAAAEIAGISRVALTRYENGQRMPKMNIVTSLAEAYGVTVDYLMGREEPAKDGAEAYPPHLQETYRVLSQLTPQELAEVVEVAKFKLYQRDQNK